MVGIKTIVNYNYLFMLVCVQHIVCRWISGNADALKRSTAYPTWFGRAFAKAQQWMDQNQQGDALERVIREFAQNMVNQLPPPGEVSQEETRSCKRAHCYFLFDIVDYCV